MDHKEGRPAVATLAEHEKIVELLLDAGADTNKESFPPYFIRNREFRRS